MHINASMPMSSPSPIPSEVKKYDASVRFGVVVIDRCQLYSGTTKPPVDSSRNKTETAPSYTEAISTVLATLGATISMKKTTNGVRGWD